MNAHPCPAGSLSGVSPAALADEADAGVQIPPKPAASDGQVVIFENRATGPVRIMNAVNGAPAAEGTENFAAWRAAEIPFARTHDLSHVASYGGNHAVDITCIFTDFEADAENPASYDFANTETPPEANADGSIDLVLRPCSFAYLELEGNQK